MAEDHREQGLDASIAALWDQARERALARVDVVEDAVATLLGGPLDGGGSGARRARAHRLDRARLLRASAMTDPVTGLELRGPAYARMRRLVRHADRLGQSARWACCASRASRPTSTPPTPR